jgi:hypothetical protein
MTVIDFEPDSSADFADPYARLLNAALGERNLSLSPNLRECYLTLHVARVIFDERYCRINTQSGTGTCRNEASLIARQV